MRYKEKNSEPKKRGPKEKPEHLKVEAIGTTARRCDIETVESVHGNIADLLRSYIKELASNIEQNRVQS